jgi:hypothetical protein
MLDGRRHGRPGSLGIGHRVGIGHRLTARSFDLIDYVLGAATDEISAVRRRAQVVDDDARTLSSEQVRVRAAQPGTGPGDEDHIA